MNLRLTLPAAALGCAALTLVPSTSTGWVPLGGSLPLDQRDFRVFDNFTAPSANDNASIDPSFPGHSGAELAIWKACVEWGSALHGDGQGDPHQPGDLGSGGANFDSTYQGLATGVGGIDDNIHSQVSSCQTGVLAYMEAGTTVQDGWRIRYCGSQVWEDGPDSVVGASHRDLQGIATHEYGHALGLDHSTIASASMFPTASGAGVQWRSISADDKAGVQAIYGAASSAKPFIEEVSVSGSAVSIRGRHFAPTQNAIWFTRADPTGDGTPVAVVGLDSQAGGTRLRAAIPPEAGAGDVLVRVPGAGGGALSNAYPFAPRPGPTGIGSSFCNATPNSTGRSGHIRAFGSDFADDDELALIAEDLPVHRAGFFLMGNARVGLQPPGSAGVLCVGGTLVRLLPGLSNSGANGTFRRDVGTDHLPAVGSLAAGQTWNFTAWYRDSGSSSNFTDAVGIAFR